jgi:peptidoglycan/xylan/chitin deacetylase (PgdA/CDA1 family)
VLLYHRVAPPSPWDPYDLAVEPRRFEQHLRVARALGHVVTVDELVSRLAAGRPTAGLVAVTFDDGYADNLAAARIAATQQVPVTVFVATGACLGGPSFWWDELAALVADGRPSKQQRATLASLHALLRAAPAHRRTALLRQLRLQSVPATPRDRGRPLTPDELHQLAGLPGVTVGAHTVTHPSLARLDALEQVDEMRTSRAWLEHTLGCAVDFLAYPFGKDGDVSETTKATASLCGFRAAFTTSGAAVHASTELTAISRLSVHDWTEGVFASKLDSLLR